METMSAACCLIARVHRNRTITPADKVRAPDLKGCRREFTSPVSAFECAFWDGTPGLCARRPDRIPLDRARWVWQSPCGLIKIVTYTGIEFSHIVYNRASTPMGVVSASLRACTLQLCFRDKDFFAWIRIHSLAFASNCIHKFFGLGQVVRRMQFEAYARE